MDEEKVISGQNEEIVWQQIESDFKIDPLPLQYHVVLEQDGQRILLDMHDNHAVGFEASASTELSAYIYNRNGFKFAIHKEGFVDEIGKFLGMQDYVLGYKDFDDTFVIKTNDEQKVNLLFADGAIREALMAYPDLTFGIVEYLMEESDGKIPFLELCIKKSVTDTNALRSLYTAFRSVLLAVEK